jgi:hypothetical protein
MISDDNSIQIIPGFGKISQGATVPITFLVPQKYASFFLEYISKVAPDMWVAMQDSNPNRIKITGWLEKEPE